MFVDRRGGDICENYFFLPLLFFHIVEGFVENRIYKKVCEFVGQVSCKINERVSINIDTFLIKYNSLRRNFIHEKLEHAI